MRIERRQIEQAKQIVLTVSLEIWQDVLTEEDLRRYDSMSDIEQVQSHYFDNNGVFLVLVDDDPPKAAARSGRVVGTGAIRKLSDEVCELKRMWFLKAYRGQGWGRKMAQLLFDFAQQAGYRKVRLDLANEARQSQAFNFYKRLGFYPIERYNDSSCTVFMEKWLEPS